MNRPYSLGAARFLRHGRDVWAEPSHQTAWQRERMRGKILPMETKRKSIFVRIWDGLKQEWRQVQ